MFYSLAESGLYYYRARSYDAALGRFLQRDPAGMADGPNMYLYCGNDPVNGRDPSGMRMQDVVKSWMMRIIIGHNNVDSGGTRGGESEYSDPDPGTLDCATMCLCKDAGGTYDCDLWDIVFGMGMAVNQDCYADCNFANGFYYLLLFIRRATWMKPQGIGMAHM